MMKELFEYRKSLVNRLVSSANEFRTECLNVKDQYAPLEEGGWNTHQIATHIRDVDKLVYGLRARRTVSESNPEFQFFDGDAYMAEHYSPEEPLDQILNSFVENIAALAQMLRELPAEAWSRESRHTTLGHGLTLQSWVERNLAHIEEHLKTVKKGK
jgi:hypothetical protein